MHRAIRSYIQLRDLEVIQNTCIVKLINIQRHLCHFEREYKSIQNNTTAEKLKTEQLFVSNNLQCSDEIKKDSDGNSVEKMINTFEQIKTNLKIRQHQPGYVLSLLNGYILYSKLINIKNLRQAGGARIKFEFDARGIIHQFEHIVQSKEGVVTKLAKALKQNDKIRFEKDLDEDLRQVGIEFTVQTKVGAKLAMLKDEIDKREEGSEPLLNWSLYEIDRNRYFKKQSNAYDCLDVLKT